VCALRTVRIVSDLEAHLATDGVHYDIVVIPRLHNRAEFDDLLTRCLPGARIVDDPARVEAELGLRRSVG
jgi:hypothetical protein